MHVDPVFASWVRTGKPHPPGSPPGTTEAERFAAYERVIMRRTNSLVSVGRLGVPWPRALGTPPWGALRELEYGAARHGTQYGIQLWRGGSAAYRTAMFDSLVAVVVDGEPALLYVGSPTLPRHVALVLPGDGDRSLDVYDPASGRVSHLRQHTVVQRRMRLAGWDVPWLVVRPTGERRVTRRTYRPGLGTAPA
ncbi:MAG: hypothetical protein ACRCXL_06020 [Dermatophilaceae bacterium]